MMNTPKAVADELLALARDKDEIKKALVESGAEVGEEDGFASYPDKIRGLKHAGIKIYKAQQFYQFIDEVLPPLKIDEGYASPDLSWSLGRCPNLVQVPSIDGVDRAVNMESFIHESKKVKKLILPDMPNLTNVKNIAYEAKSLESVEIGSMPVATTMHYSFSGCDSLMTSTLGESPMIDNAFAVFYNCPRLRHVKLSMAGGLISSVQYMFDKCVNLEEVEGVIHLAAGANVSNFLTGCAKLREIRVKGISTSLVAFESTNLSLESARYLINEARTVTGQTIHLPQKLVDDHEDEMTRLGESASAKGWTISYR